MWVINLKIVNTLLRESEESETFVKNIDARTIIAICMQYSTKTSTAFFREIFFRTYFGAVYLLSDIAVRTSLHLLKEQIQHETSYVSSGLLPIYGSLRTIDNCCLSYCFLFMAVIHF